MGDTCTGFWWRNPREKDQWGHPGIDLEGNIRMELQEVRYWGMDWIELAQDRDSLWALVNYGNEL